VVSAGAGRLGEPGDVLRNGLMDISRAVAPEIAANTVSLKDLQVAGTNGAVSYDSNWSPARGVVDILTHPAPAPAVATVPAAECDDVAGTGEAGPTAPTRLKLTAKTEPSAGRIRNVRTGEGRRPPATQACRLIGSG